MDVCLLLLTMIQLTCLPQLFLLFPRCLLSTREMFQLSSDPCSFLVIFSKRWPISLCGFFTSNVLTPLACKTYSIYFCNSTLTNHPYQVITQWSNTIPPCMVSSSVLFFVSLLNLLPCKNLQVNENRFASVFHGGWWTTECLPFHYHNLVNLQH